MDSPAKSFRSELEEERIKMQIKLLEMDIEANQAMIDRANRDDKTSWVMTFLTGFALGIVGCFLYMISGV